MNNGNTQGGHQGPPGRPDTVRRTFGRRGLPPDGPGEPPAPGGPTGDDPTAGEQLEHDGRFGELFVIFLQNLLLSVITLGIYRFWGKTRIRRYIWSHTSFRGERLEYSGTGLELFFGFLIALALLGAPFIGWYVWVLTDPPGERNPFLLLQQIGVLYLLLFLLFYLNGVAIYAAQRFRSSRTTWHGIRGGLEGSAWVYGFLAIGLAFLNGLSMGWTKPWADATLLEYRLKRTCIGDQTAVSKVRVEGLYGPFAMAWCATVGALTIGGIVLSIVFAGVIAQGPKEAQIDPFAITIASYAFILFAVATYYLSIHWYWARLLRNTAGGTWLGDVRFTFTPTYGELLALNLPNTLMLIFSVGFAYPYVLLRKARFIARHLQFEGRLDEARLGQHGGYRPRVGEGLIEFLGVGGI